MRHAAGSEPAPRRPPVSDASARTWLALPLVIGAGDGARSPLSREELVGLAAAIVLDCGGFGLEESAALPGTDEVAGRDELACVAWLAEGADVATISQALRDALETLGGGVRVGAAELVEDPGWVEAFNATLTPVDVGERFTIVPGVGEAPPGRLALEVAPGRAFGTGHHESTRLCLEWVERVVRPGARVRDVGTGTGILAFAAARLGAARVVASDVDPEAIEVAAGNLERLPERDVVELRLGDGLTDAGLSGRPDVRLSGRSDVPPSGRSDAGLSGRFDVVVANITIDVILPMLADLVASLEPDGVLVLSGLLRIDEESVEAALAERGLDDVRWRRAGEWSSCAARAR